MAEPHWLLAWMRLRREQLGLTQTEAANRAGLTQSAWARVERGGAGVTLDTLDRMWGALLVRVVLLSTDGPTMPERER